MSAPKLFLFDHPVSSYAQKVRITLREKSLSYTTQSTVGASDPTPDFIAANPRREVPTLMHGTDAVFDSTVILEFLEDLAPEPALLPPRSDPGARARVRMLEDVADTQYEAINWVWGEILWMGRADGKGGLRDHIKTQVEAQTRELYAWLEGKLAAREFFGGAYGFSIADAALMPLVHRSMHYGFAPTEGGKLAGWYARCRQRESVETTLQEFEKGVAMMSAAAEAFRSGQKKREYRDHRIEAMIRMGGIEIVEEGIRRQNIRFSWPGEDGVQFEGK